MNHRSILLAAHLLASVACSESPDASAGWPEQPATFRIELSGSPCFGNCPTYSLSIDQDGQVTFIGERCVARPGVFSQTVSQQDARAVYDALLATPFASLGDRYVTPADGCRTRTDAPTSTWQVSANEREKSLVRYGGCEGIPALKKVDAVEPIVRSRAGVLAWLEPVRGSCRGGSVRMASESYRLSVDGAAVGVLQIEGDRGYSGTFELRDCTGGLTAQGDVSGDQGRLLLLEGTRSPLALPGTLGSAGSLILDGEQASDSVATDPFAPTRAHALRADDEILLELTVAASCS